MNQHQNNKLISGVSNSENLIALTLISGTCVNGIKQTMLLMGMEVPQTHVNNTLKSTISLVINTLSRTSNATTICYK